ncbi:MAG: pyruvate kinase [Pseudomonadota bacterium]|nr:pyruvate kinase [Pseudomonadota bacterium]
MAARERLRRSRRTKIVATLGPASSTPEMIQRLVQTGADVFRLNFSHGDHPDHAERMAMIREAEAKFRRPIGVLADVQGPKLRVGRFSGGGVFLKPGQSLRLDLNPTPGDGRRANLPHPEIIEAAREGASLLLDDGKLRLQVTRKGPDFLDTVVAVGGRLSDRKGVNVPDVVLNIPALTVKDRADLAFALDIGCDFIGLSFVQRPEDVIEARELVQGRAWIISKLEKPQALDKLDEIIALSDGVMVARGDLGVELPPEDVPIVQKRIVRRARQMGKPVIVATQMLESMITAPTPTRAEASDVATAVFDGADAVMLSAETAAGQYPLEAVAIMDRIIDRVEQDADWRAGMDRTRPEAEHVTSDAIAAAAAEVARNVEAQAIAALTQSASTALRISRQRPVAPIIGMTPLETTARRLALAWGVHAVLSPPVATMTEAVGQALLLARRDGFVTFDQSVVVVAGVPFGQAGATNALRVATLSRDRNEPKE